MIKCAAVFDIGTSSLKAALIDKNGNTYCPQRYFFTQPITEDVWLNSFYLLFAELEKFSVADNIKIAGICISGNGPSLVAVSDKSRNAKIMLWNEDIEASFDKPQTSSIFIPRLLILKKKYSDIFYNSEIIFSAPEYLLYKLTGLKITVLPEKRYEQFYWTKADLNKFELDEKKLPPFAFLGDKAGFFRNIPVFCGASDFTAALIGTNTMKAGNACDRTGTSEGINICIKTPPPKEKLKGLLLLPSPISGLWNISFLIPNSGKLFYDYVKKTETGMDFEGAMQKILHSLAYSSSKQESNNEGLILVRNLAEKIQYGCSLLENACGFLPEYVISGGQAKNALWIQIKANLTGRSFVLSNNPDAELLGNAVVVFTSLGEYKNIAEAASNMVKKTNIYYPASVLG